MPTPSDARPAAARSLITRVTSLGSRLLFPDVRELRWFALATLVDAFGAGFSLSVLPLYLTRVAGLSPAEVGIGLGTGTIVGLMCGIPAGWLADRTGPRGLQIWVLVGLGLASICYPLVTSFWEFIVIAALIGCLGQAGVTVGSVLVASLAGGQARGELRASLRVLNNVGLMAGGAMSSLAFYLDTPLLYRIFLVGDGLSFFGAALLYARLPYVSPGPRTVRRSGFAGVRDRRYLTVISAFVVLQLNAAILWVALPLWISAHEYIPRPLISLLVVIDMGGLMLLQVPVTRRISTAPTALRGARWAGLFLFISCVVFAATSIKSTAVAVGLLVLGTLVYLVGQVLQSSAQFVLAYELADESAQGAYQGAFSTGFALALGIGPFMMAILPLRIGAGGWIALGLLFLAAGGLMFLVASVYGLLKPTSLKW